MYQGNVETLKNGKRVELKANNFDWNMQDPRIGFKDNMLIAMEGSVGYGIGGARVEVEVGYERFKTRGIRDSGNKEDEGDTVYLLAKELAYNVLTDQTDKLAAALAKVPGKDIVAFAQALKASDAEIEQQICKAGTKASGAPGNGNYGGTCGGKHNSSVTNTWTEPYPGLLTALSGKGSGKWPNINVDGSTGNAAGSDGTKTVAGDIISMTKDDKAIVAGHLAKSIEGGEVVEIRSVSSTSVMVNACYDLLSEGISVVPYAFYGVLQ